MPAMLIGRAHFTGAAVATCPSCGSVNVYWDSEDLNDNGELECCCQDINVETMGGR